MAARADAAMGPTIGVVAPAVKNAVSKAMNAAMIAIQKATLIEILEYCVSRAKLSACRAL